MSLSKKSRYIPPHLRENNKDIVIANPDDEMGPPQQQASPYHHQQAYRQSSRHPQPPINNALMNDAAPNITPSSNVSSHAMHPPPNLVHPHSNQSYSPSRRPYTTKTPKSRPINDNNWRKATPTEQPQLNPLDLLPNDVIRNVQENSNQNQTENSVNNHRHYDNKPKAYNSRRTRGQRGRNPQRRRGRGAPHYHNNNYGYIEDDPNEIQFAKMDAAKHDIDAHPHPHPHPDPNGNNPYDESPFIMESNEAPPPPGPPAPAPQPPPPPPPTAQYKVKYVKKEDRYNRQYVSCHDASAKENNDHNIVNQENEESLNHYELSSNFQTLTTKNRPQRRRRNNRQNGASCAAKHVQKSPPKTPQKSPKNSKDKSPTIHSANNVNTVQLTLPTKRKAAPINWAEKLKPKAVPIANARSTFIPHNNKQTCVGNADNEILDSSQPICLDSHKVSHVLEVLNMRAADYQSVLTVLRHFCVEYTALLSVNKRWFLVFDCHKTAINALNAVKHNEFKLRRIDTNLEDVKMLKNNVPPPFKTNHEWL